ncbi:MAG: RnfH family protein [Burkholderiaceae bacterium]|jgi:putative ubiquitin-RnfH superfamily antitoxin RatB of RatAB toxin-antitoxin module|nr:RnfH family protein [Burkholderiaceae bacterium]
MLRITLAYAPAARTLHMVDLLLPAGSRVSDALQAARQLECMGDVSIDWLECAIGVWGRKVKPGQLLRDHDRVEIYRPLRVDPKVARRERFDRQGARRVAGLFAKRRPGAKPGY